MTHCLLETAGQKTLVTHISVISALSEILYLDSLLFAAPYFRAIVPLADFNGSMEERWDRGRYSLMRCYSLLAH